MYIYIYVYIYIYIYVPSSVLAYLCGKWPIYRIIHIFKAEGNSPSELLAEGNHHYINMFGDVPTLHPYLLWMVAKSCMVETGWLKPLLKIIGIYQLVISQPSIPFHIYILFSLDWFGKLNLNVFNGKWPMFPIFGGFLKWGYRATPIKASILDWDVWNQPSI